MSKISLLILGLVLLACLAAAAKEEDSSLTVEEEVSSLRQVRDADARKKRKRGRRNRKGGRRSRKRKHRKNKNARQSTTVSAACFEQSLTVMRMWKDTITNFEKQRKRMEKQNETGGNKAGKKGVFGPIALRLVDLGGGNKSALSCAGNTTNEGAKQMKNLTDTLFACEKSVHDACHPSNLPQPNLTYISMCSELAAKFQAGAKDCLSKSIGGSKVDPAMACSCWTNSSLTEIVDAAKMCKASNESSAIAAGLKSCKSAFSTCRKFEDDAITTIMSCNSDSSKLVTKAATLNTNSDAVKSAQNTVKTLANSTRSGMAASTCAEVVTYATKLAGVATNFPASPQISTIAAMITGASSVNCTAAEKTSLTEVDTSLETALTTITMALDAVQEQLETLTGSTASSGQLSSASMTTKAARRQRNFRI